MHTTYYAPHVSGLTIYFQRLAEEYVKLGHEVTMLTSRHEATLPREEKVNDVRVVRSAVWLKVNKGLLMPMQIFDAWSALRQADTVHFNLPAFEAWPIAIMARLLGKRVVSTYVCDITLPKFFLSRVLQIMADLANWLTLRLSHQVVSYTLDFAEHSRLLKRFPQVREIYPQVDLPSSDKATRSLELLAEQPGPVVGMATRMAADKGIEYMLQAIPALQKNFPTIKVAFVGSPSPVGEQRYVAMLSGLFKQFADRILLLGELPQAQMNNFYQALDVLVVASTNSTEAFGIVQIEAMLAGIPVVATDLPGVRMPIRLTGMGEVVKRASSEELAAGITKVLQNPSAYFGDRAKIAQMFDSQTIVKQYLQLYSQNLLSSLSRQ